MMRLVVDVDCVNDANLMIAVLIMIMLMMSKMKR